MERDRGWVKLGRVCECVGQFNRKHFATHPRLSGTSKKNNFYSDGCTYQNRNCVMSNALLCTAMNHNLIIEQKFLEVGHTQMEADCMHSTIERALKNKDINVPAEYISICKLARKKPKTIRRKISGLQIF